MDGLPSPPLFAFRSARTWSFTSRGREWPLLSPCWTQAWRSAPTWSRQACSCNALKETHGKMTWCRHPTSMKWNECGHCTLCHAEKTNLTIPCEVEANSISRHAEPLSNPELFLRVWARYHPSPLKLDHCPCLRSYSGYTAPPHSPWAGGYCHWPQVQWGAASSCQVSGQDTSHVRCMACTDDWRVRRADRIRVCRYPQLARSKIIKRRRWLEQCPRLLDFASILGVVSAPPTFVQKCIALLSNVYLYVNRVQWIHKIKQRPIC